MIQVSGPTLRDMSQSADALRASRVSTGLRQDSRSSGGWFATFGALLGLLAFSPAPRLAAQTPEGNPLVGAWDTERYQLASGPLHVVRGRIFFTERDWTVLFFVVDGDGEPQRGSAEGGTYTLEGDRLVFTHQFNLSAGGAMDGLPEQALQMILRDESGQVLEPATIQVNGQRLTIHFPSGNAMTFRKRS